MFKAAISLVSTSTLFVDLSENSQSNCGFYNNILNMFSSYSITPKFITQNNLWAQRFLPALNVSFIIKLL